MTKTLAIMTGLALTGGMAIAAQAQETQDYDPNRDIVTQTERDRGTTMDTPRQDTPIQSEYGTEPETQTESDMSTDPYGTDQSQSQTGTTTDPYSAEPESDTTEDSASQSASAYGEEIGKDISEMSSEDLSGKTVISSTGEEIGDIDEVGYSSTHQERVAVIEVGGFLGVGEKRIAVPLSDLEAGTDDGIQTSLSRESIEAQEEFDEAGFTADQAESGAMEETMDDHSVEDETTDDQQE
jgi:sporulation protein YlmC with PRC-barrel domain